MLSRSNQNRRIPNRSVPFLAASRNEKKVRFCALCGPTLRAVVSRARRSHSRPLPAPRPPTLTPQCRRWRLGAPPPPSLCRTHGCPSQHARLPQRDDPRERVRRGCGAARIVTLQIGRVTRGSQVRVSSTQPLSGARLARDAASSEERARTSAVTAQSSRQDSDRGGDAANACYDG